MKQSFFVAAFAAAMTAFAVQAAQTYRIEECGPAAEAFSFYLDASGSMMETIGDVKEKAQEEYEKLASEGWAQTRERPVPPANDKTDGLRRAELAESLVLKSAGVAADKAGMTSSLYAVAPFAVLVPPEKRTAEAYGKAVRERFHNKMEVFGRPTWLGERGFKHFSAPRTGKEVAVLITDGNFDVRTEGKRSPVEALRAYGTANPGSCVHIVSAAYLPAEKKAVAELAQVLPCTKTFELEALMTDDAQFADFAETVFYKDCSKAAGGGCGTAGRFVRLRQGRTDGRRKGDPAQSPEGRGVSGAVRTLHDRRMDGLDRFRRLQRRSFAAARRSGQDVL